MFNVTDFETAYNIILGRPTLAKFLAAMHYAYQCVKMFEPEGGIIIRGCPKADLCCDKSRHGISTPTKRGTKKLKDQGG